MTCFEADGSVCEPADHPFVDAAYLAGRWIFYACLKGSAVALLAGGIATAHTYRRCTRSHNH